MRAQTAAKLAVVGVICILFAGVILRAAMKLAATAMHSILFMILLVVLVLWIAMKGRR